MRTLASPVSWLSLAFAAVLATTLAISAHAELISSVDQQEIDEMQTLELVVRETGTNDPADIDLSPLDADFEVQSITTQSQFRSVNGRVSSWVDYHVTLRPKRTGQLTIPALTLRGQTSTPIQVRVRAVTAEMKSQIDRLVYFDVSLDTETVYVQAQAILTRRLYYTAGVQIYGDLPGAPELQNAVVLTLGEANSNSTMIEGRRYGVLEQRYAIFPERSGTLTIPGFFVTSSVQFADRGRRGVRVEAEEKVLTVLPVPSEYPADIPWFPARNVALTESWQPNSQDLKAGDALTRTIVTIAQGATGSAIPPLFVELPEEHFKQYPQPPKINDDAQGRWVVGTREQAYELISTHGGVVRTQPVRVGWWDTDEHRFKTSQLEPRVVRIDGPPPASKAPPSAVSNAVEPPTSTPQIKPPIDAIRYLWWLAAAIVALALLVIGYRLAEPRLAHALRPTPAKQARSAIRRATTPGEMQFQLNKLAANHWHVGAASASAEIRRRCTSGAVVLDALNRTAYSPTPGSLDESRKQALKLAKEILRYKRPRVSQDSALPPLYPAAN